jgi:hypothetical protein
MTAGGAGTGPDSESRSLTGSLRLWQARTRDSSLTNKSSTSVVHVISSTTLSSRACGDDWGLPLGVTVTVSRPHPGRGHCGTPRALRRWAREPTVSHTNQTMANLSDRDRNVSRNKHDARWLMVTIGPVPAARGTTMTNSGPGSPPHAWKEKMLWGTCNANEG